MFSLVMGSLTAIITTTAVIEAAGGFLPSGVKKVNSRKRATKLLMTVN